MNISFKIDLSKPMGEARDQGKRPTCLAFALSDINRNAVGAQGTLSPEYLYRTAANNTPMWKPHVGLQLAHALAAVTSPGQPSELDCPYSPAEPIELPPALPPLTCAMYSSPVAEIPCTIDAILRRLQRGKPVGLIIKITQAFFKPVNGAITYSPMVLPGLRHAVIATGVGETAGVETHVRIRNSWGSAWGVGGSAWLPLEYVQSHTTQAFVHDHGQTI